MNSNERIKEAKPSKAKPRKAKESKAKPNQAGPYRTKPSKANKPSKLIPKRKSCKSGQTNPCHIQSHPTHLMFAYECCKACCCIGKCCINLLRMLSLLFKSIPTACLASLLVLSLVPQLFIRALCRHNIPLVLLSVLAG